MNFARLKVTLCEKIIDYLQQNSGIEFEQKQKEDGSPVTHFDLAFSKIVSEILDELFPGIPLVDEENFNGNQPIDFPCFVLDPIDGTKEFATRIPQWSLSLAYLNSNSTTDEKNWGMIFNPISGFLASSDEDIPFSLGNNHTFNNFQANSHFTGLVSRSEYFNGLFDEMHLEGITFSPLGSIAYKLGVLSRGGCDFVWTLRPKSLWDIAAGVVLLHQRGYNFYQDGIMQESFQSRYDQPLFFGPGFLEKKTRLMTQKQDWN